jgi:predicted RNase H-like nuclease (RuvC/YqgF family)
LAKVRQVKPDILATDNLLELASTEKRVIDFLSKLPSKTRAIQVTGSPIHGMTSLTKLSKRHGLLHKKHLAPIEAAIVIAQLAGLGVGTEISAVARETRIVVSRSRKIGPGGFSQARYQRRMHGAIRQVARSIIEKLVKSDMDFDQYETRTSHGWSRCVIHVYDSIDNVTKIVHSEVNRNAGVAIRISPVKHRSILYLQQHDKNEQLVSRQSLIVGVDSGTTVGIAISDISGRIVALHSGRGMSRGDVIRYLVNFGKPILITADVSPPSTFIEKLGTTLQVPLHVPEKLLSVVEKRELAKSLTKGSEFQPKNAHQRDALAAIGNMFLTYERKLTLLRNRIDESENQHSVTEATKVILQGGSIHEALDQSIIVPELKPCKTDSAVTASPIEKILTKEELQECIQQLQRQVDSLNRQLEYEKSKLVQSEERNRELEKEIRQTKRRLNRALNREERERRRDELIRRKNEEINRLRQSIKNADKKLETTEKTISSLKLMRRLENLGEVQPVLVLPHFSQDDIRQITTGYSKEKAKIILVQDPSGGGSSTAEQLINFGVQVIIINGTMSHLALDKFTSSHIPVIEAKKLRITLVDEFAVVDVQQLEKEIRNWQKSHKITEYEDAADALERLIEEYRLERRNEESERK